MVSLSFRWSYYTYKNAETPNAALFPSPFFKDFYQLQAPESWTKLYGSTNIGISPDLNKNIHSRRDDPCPKNTNN